MALPPAGGLRVKLIIILICAFLIAGSFAPALAAPPVNRNQTGEVEFPVIRATHAPQQAEERHTLTTSPTTPVIHTPTGTTATATQTTPTTTSTTVTTMATTTSTPAPVVTVTVFVYPSGAVYYPVYYYPPGYPYPPGSLVVTSDPSGATVTVDGFTTETTPFVFSGLMPGYHTLEIDFPGYEVYTANVNIVSGVTNELDATLVPLVSPGSLSVDSVPEGADVFVDGNFEGTTALVIGGLAPGLHRIELHRAGYDVASETVTINPGEETTASLVLPPYTPSSATGSLDISANVPGALIYLDGVYKGSTRGEQSYNVIAVSPGSHSILLHAPGYDDFTEAITVNPGEITSVNAVLSPAPAQSPPSTGALVVSSSPAGGQVFIDNVFRGITPVTLYNIDAGTHLVTMRLAGFTDWSGSVQVPAGQTEQVAGVFSPVPIPTKSGIPGPALVAGISAALFILVVLRRR